MHRFSQTQNPLRFLSRPAARARRQATNAQGYSTVPPPSGSPAPNPLKSKKPDNTMLYTVLGLGGAAGAYIYLKNPEKVQGVKEDAHREKEKLEQQGREKLDSAKDRASESLRRGERQLDEFKEGSKERMDEARARMDNASRDFEARGKGFSEDVEDKMSAAKEGTAKRLERARDSTENLYKEARESASRKTNDVKEDIERKKEGAKKSWSEWLGWGQSKANAGVDKTVEASEGTKRSAAQKVASTAEDVRDRAAKHA